MITGLNIWGQAVTTILFLFTIGLSKYLYITAHILFQMEFTVPGGDKTWKYK